MSTVVPSPDRIPMSQPERDRLMILRAVRDGRHTQAEAARLLGLSDRHVRRLLQRLDNDGDEAVVHRLRGRPSNHACDPAFKARVLDAYRARYADFGPTFAGEKLAQEGLDVAVETLRRWLVEAGLWRRQRRRDPHRTRRPRRACFGELVQIDASIHDWLEGRGETVVLITLIDDATSRLLARFYPAGTVETHMDLLWRWLSKYGRPKAIYSDRHSIFEPQDKGKALPGAVTQFGRALGELDIELICAHSPQAKGRVERSFGTAQDRWVKELRLAGATTADEANAVLARVVPDHNRRFAKEAKESRDAHRALGREHRLEAILSIQEQRVVSNDYVVRFQNRYYQVLPPAYPGLRRGQVVVEQRLDGSLALRFGERYLTYQEIGPEGPGSEVAGPREAEAPEQPQEKEGGGQERKPGPDHPWRKPYKRQK
jgi:molybdenum-dependent DNA-binding transcriptional regulator ModE